MEKIKKKTEFDIISEKLDKVISLNQQLIAISAYKWGMSIENIAKSLKIRRANVDKIVRGMQKEK